MPKPNERKIQFEAILTGLHYQKIDEATYVLQFNGDWMSLCLADMSGPWPFISAALSSHLFNSAMNTASPTTRAERGVDHDMHLIYVLPIEHIPGADWRAVLAKLKEPSLSWLAGYFNETVHPFLASALTYELCLHQLDTYFQNLPSYDVHRAVLLRILGRNEEFDRFTGKWLETIRSHNQDIGESYEACFARLRLWEPDRHT